MFWQKVEELCSVIVPDGIHHLRSMPSSESVRQSIMLSWFLSYHLQANMLPPDEWAEAFLHATDVLGALHPTNEEEAELIRFLKEELGSTVSAGLRDHGLLHG